jgi:hypothetical protein
MTSYPTSHVGAVLPVAGTTAPMDPPPELPEVSQRINALDHTPVTGKTAPDPAARSPWRQAEPET